MHRHPDTEVILMDDAFQHRRVKPGLQILLTEYYKPFYKDNLLPYGRLREGPEGAARANVIIVTKCPDHLEEDQMMSMENAIKNYAHAPVFFSKIRYGEPIPFGIPKKQLSANVILISGIANHHVLEEYVTKYFNLMKHFAFSDHRNYSVDDLKRVENYMKNEKEIDLNNVSILTTEKDKVKLTSDMFAPFLDRLPFFYLPIEMEFIGSGRDFDAFVKTFLTEFSSE
jgi:tetraacyldisaccharide 4'-kinase